MDEPARCPWCLSHPEYVAYHDAIWGVPVRDDRALFEKLLLDGFQAGLSWWIILKKSDGFRAAFEGFHPERMAGWGPRELDALKQDARIVRNRAKIDASVANARAFLRLVEEEGSFSDFLWGFVDGAPIQNAWRDLGQIPAATPRSEAMAKALKQRGFKFCGPTITYAFMQATGMVNDHLVSCPRHAALGGRPPS
jgi:DNA-3-methyladenine glycosylase I